MKIVSFTYCEDVQNDPQGKPIIIAPMQMIVPQFLPTTYSFNVSFGIADVPKEGFSIKTEFWNPKGEKVSENILQVPPLPVEKIAFPNLPFGLQVNIGFRNVVLDVQGEYKTVILINNKEYSEYPIGVYHAD